MPEIVVPAFISVTLGFVVFFWGVPDPEDCVFGRLQHTGTCLWWACCCCADVDLFCGNSSVNQL